MMHLPYNKLKKMILKELITLVSLVDMTLNLYINLLDKKDLRVRSANTREITFLKVGKGNTSSYWSNLEI